MTDTTSNAIPAPHARHDLKAESLSLLREREVLKGLWGAWEAQFQAASGQVPPKASLRMQALKTVLPCLIISELIDADTVHIRLAGSRVDEMFGGGLTGANTVSLSPPAQQEAIARVYRNIAATPAGFYISESLLMRDGKVNRNDALILPLADNKDGSIRYFVGAYHLGRDSFAHAASSEAAIIHRNIDAFGYLDLGFGLPD
ncbi:PAS domain-containing protein [Kordiimonas marina]|uniref:PAS domain-containing protein n=1 Tax=Kordiimonas marina TaxID=2872312 RepID=UPI001FF527CC|nr:PAS domain-containing protein [Kordiimonas marina]MCJ9430579.1 PAS domain-containing protein [Kordiimonas marina]